MEDKEEIIEEIIEENNEKEEKKPFGLLSILVVLLVFVSYFAIVMVTEYLGDTYGKIVEMGGLIVVGIILLIMFYRSSKKNKD